MTLSDLLGHLRARNGGAYFSEVAEAIGVPVLRYVRAERTYGTAELTPEEIERLASYFHVPASELFAARDKARADLTAYLAECLDKNRPAHLDLLGGSTIEGTVVWRDRHAVAIRRLEPDGTPSISVVYRSSIEDWGAEE